MGSGGGGGQAPKTYSPGEAATAAVGTAGAGELMSIANQPIEQYSNLYTTEALGPAMAQTQSALANRAAYQSAAAQQDIQSRLDPMAYAQRQMRMQSANKRLGQLYGQDPSTFTFRAPEAYTVPGTADMPDIRQLAQGASDIASNLSLAHVDKSGAWPKLETPQGVSMKSGQSLSVPTGSQTYLK